MKEKKKCKTCGNEYRKNYKYSASQWAFSKFCSYACGALAKKNKGDARKVGMRKICIQCGNVFDNTTGYGLSQWTAKKYCSPKCVGASTRKHKDAKAKDLYHRRKRGMLQQNSPEAKAKISYYTKLAMQRPEVQEKIRAPREALTLEHRMKLSDIHAGKMPANMNYQNQNYGKFANVQRGEYDINGTTIYFRSKWEANYALYLDFLIDHKEIVKWEFEPDTYMFEQIKLGTRSYTPDFKVFLKDGSFEYHEVKGYMDSKSKTKLKRMKKYYPKIVVRLVDQSEYKLLVKQLGKLCKFY